VTTDANGQASGNASTNTVAGSYTVTATVGSLNASFSLVNDPGPLGQLVFKIQPPATVSVDQRFRLQVQLRDQFGNAVRLPNVAVRLRLLSGSGPGCWSSGRVLTLGDVWRPGAVPAGTLPFGSPLGERLAGPLAGDRGKLSQTCRRWRKDSVGVGNSNPANSHPSLVSAITPMPHTETPLRESFG